MAPGFLESEALVRVLWADQGDREDLLAVLDGVRSEAAAMRDQVVALTEQYLAGTGDYQDRAHVNALIARFLVDFSTMASAWASWATAVVEPWEDTAPRPTDDATLTALRQTLAGAKPA